MGMVLAFTGAVPWTGPQLARAATPLSHVCAALSAVRGRVPRPSRPATPSQFTATRASPPRSLGQHPEPKVSWAPAPLCAATLCACSRATAPHRANIAASTLAPLGTSNQAALSQAALPTVGKWNVAFMRAGNARPVYGLGLRVGPCVVWALRFGKKVAVGGMFSLAIDA